ncbi:30S ribosomal protein S20 [Bacteroidota bacterium]
MANHKSALKRIRQSAQNRLSNRYYGKSTRNAIKELRNTSNKEEAYKMLPKIVSMIDKLQKRNQIHKNKAANLKSSLTKYVNSLSQ